MEWHDEGFILGGKTYGETSLILEVMTRAHGRHLGLVKGGRSKRMQSLLQPGNSVEVTWRARLEEHLGFYAVEPIRLRAGDLMGSPVTLHGLNIVTGLLRLLAEREPSEPLFEQARSMIDDLSDEALGPRHLVLFELAILAACGFGVDLETCAATGTREDLTWVSPKTARAVCRAAGDPYKGRLLRLPRFLTEQRVNQVPVSDLRDGFALAEFFLTRHLFAPRGLMMPRSHESYVTLLDKSTVPKNETLPDRESLRRSVE